MKEIITTVIMLIGVVMVVLYYQPKLGFASWQMFDSGMLVIALSFVYNSWNKYLLSIVSWLFFAVVLNSWITSTFFDVSVFGWNQKIFAWFIVGIVLSSTLTYCMYKFHVKVKMMNLQHECTKDAKSKYKEIKTEISNLHERLDIKLQDIEDKSGLVDKFIQKLENGI